jgi:hypothetical protein
MSNGESDKCDGIPTDSPITAAALAPRGIVMAQLGDLVRAKALPRSVVRAFGPKEAMPRDKCHHIGVPWLEEPRV